ncbi:inorganic diphosphatase [Candidatus Micrarchaeota archaeon]|nr:inorganic diphosphatase [Candidatus Micrarchaeota archaeon]
MNIWHDVPIGKAAPETINVVIEIPRGSQNKYELDKETGLVKLDRVLHSAVFYPGDYGIVPRTLAEDGDPADVIVLVTQPTFPGVLMECRPIAVLGMIDKGEKDDKILCVPKDDPRFFPLKDLKDVPKAILDEISNFFATYKLLENKKVEISGWKDASAAKAILSDCKARYDKKYPRN